MKSDEELLLAWRAGDKAAADSLLQRYFASLHRFFRTKVGDEVEDLVQQTLLGCIESCDRVTEGEFRAYLFGIARNRLYDRLRRRQAVDLDIDCIAHCGTSPSQKVARNQQERLLLLAMQHIPVHSQIVLELAYWEGMSGREIAQVLDISEHTVRSRMARARAALRQRLNELSPSRELAESSWASLDSTRVGNGPPQG